MRSVGWIFATALSLFFVLGPIGVAEAQSYEPEELEFLELINDYRQQNGLGPLELSAPLSIASERHSEDMGTYGFFSHTTQGSSYYPVGSEHPDRLAQEGYDYDTYTAENLAYGQTTAAEVFEAWRVSPGHNVNMLGDYSVIGIGLVWVNGTPYWTTDFGAYTDSSVSGDSTGGGKATATPDPAPGPSSGEPSNQSATPTSQASPESTPAANQQRESAAAEQYAARDQYDVAETRADEPSDQESTPEGSSPERAAEQYAEEDASSLSAGNQEAADEIAATDAVPAETASAGETVDAKPEAAEAEDTATETAGSQSAGSGTVKADGTPPSGSAGSEVAASAGISTLPDTGGVPLPLVGGAILLASGLLARRVF